jgi:Flp pilus assembly pilin Flp
MSSYFKAKLNSYKSCSMYLNMRVMVNKIKVKNNQFKCETSGVAAIEFALILPVMLLLYVGVLEITRLYGADRKAVIFAHTIADLATQASADKTDSAVQSISDSQLSLIFGLGASVLYPFKSEGASIRLTMIAFDSTVPASGLANGFVDWQETCSVQGDGVACSYGSAPLLDSPANQERCTRQEVDVGFATKNGYTMLAEVGFKYAPFLGGLYPFMPSDGMILKKNTLFMQPRSKPNVIRINDSGTPKIPHSSSGPDNYYVAIACASGGSPGGSFVP